VWVSARSRSIIGTMTSFPGASFLGRFGLDEHNLRESISGGVSGTAMIVVTHPLDTIKTQIQLQHKTAAGGDTSSAVKNMGILRTALAIYKGPDGPKGFFFGVQAALVQGAGKVALQFSIFGQLNRTIGKAWADRYGSGGEQTAADKRTQRAVAGTCAGCVESMLWTSPTERLKVVRQDMVRGTGRAAHEGAQFRGPIHTTMELFRTEGPLALHRGALPTLLRQGTQLGFRFALYSDVKNGIDYVFAGSKREGTLGEIQKFVQTMVSGASVGVLGTILNNPLDVIKTRMQRAGSEGTFRETISTILREEGVRGFYRGLAARCLKVGMRLSIIFSVFEKSNQSMGGKPL